MLVNRDKLQNTVPLKRIGQILHIHTHTSNINDEIINSEKNKTTWDQQR